MKSITHLETMNEKSLMKAACCNLSESFETNPSVDVSFSDAVSGAKQIQLLGLAGKYAQITKENMPYMRGLSNAFGLSFIPGTWIESIQLGKGAGSVVNGYESFSGQINTQLKDATSKERLFFNAYGNQNGRNEYNLNLSHKFNHKFSSSLLSHASFNPLAQDMNGDLFVDIPTGNQYNFTLKNQLYTNRGFEWQFGGNYMQDQRRGGQILPGDLNYQTWNDSLPPYLINIDNTKYDIYSKSGFVFKRQATSMGLQLNFTNHELKNNLGLNNYQGYQQTFYANYIFESFLGNTNHRYKIGSSFINDNVSDNFNSFKYKRNEQTTGIFGEYTMTPFEFFNLIIGSRIDYSNFYGFQFTPRLHSRFAFNENKTVFRISGGKAWRTANIFSDNIGLMASSRIWNIYPSDFSMPYGLNQEIGWNYGINFTQKFSLAYREGYIMFDAYRTDFTNQVITDVDENPQQVNIYNLQGESFTNTGQIEVTYELLTRLDLKIAYRYVDNQISYKGGQREIPLISKHKGFLNLGYETYNEHWLFDVTLQYNGSKRLPETNLNPSSYQLNTRSPEFWNLFGQIT
ncbi:MAG: TonB-dependent receptor plug domain-containing protein, partial [Flavobacteriales bacterium]|nr:TonB-dependent receptor plug domain-containing protein [Flavobacteriales bacterium]